MRHESFFFMSDDAALLLNFSGSATACPVALPGPVLPPNPLSQLSPAEKHTLLHRIRISIPFGFKASHMRNAGYPQLYVDVMAHLEDKERFRFPNFTSPLRLVPFDKITYNGMKTPHVVCPRCFRHFALCKDGKIRKHRCVL